jgi:hypothetical protein
MRCFVQPSGSLYNDRGHDCRGRQSRGTLGDASYSSGTFLGLPPTGRQIEIEAISIFRIANGKIVERWGLNTDLMQQLEKEG